MAAIDQTENSALDICWARGDDNPQVFTIKDDAGVVVDISAETFSMAVNTEVDPSDTVNEIFNVAGIFVTDGTDGKVSFTPPANSLDSVTAPSEAFYDVSRVTPNKRTLVKGLVLFFMDIDKA